MHDWKSDVQLLILGIKGHQEMAKNTDIGILHIMRMTRKNDISTIQLPTFDEDDVRDMAYQLEKYNQKDFFP